MPGLGKKVATAPGVYIIKDEKSDKVYVGSSGNVNRRREQHQTLLKNDKHWNPGLQEAYSSNGDLKLEVIATSSREEAFKVEQEILDQYRSSDRVFNIATDVKASTKGMKRPVETCEKISAGLTGKKYSEERKQEMSDSRKGKPVHPNTKAAYIAAISVPCSTEKKRKIGLANGSPCTYEGVSYGSFADAARANNVCVNTVRNRLMKLNKGNDQ